MNNSSTVQTVQIEDLPLWEVTRRNRTLLHLSLELTARCNNSCSHCYINLPEKDRAAIKKELDFYEIQKIIDQAVDLGCLWVHLTGGEPLLRDDFKDIYMYLKKKGLLIALFTNASLITKELIDLFKQYPPRNIEVSIYGVTQKTHKAVTRNTLFNQTRSGIEKLISASVPITLKTTILRSNVREFDKIAAWCKDKTKQPFRFDPFLHLRTDRNRKRNKEILAQRLTTAEIIELEKNDSIRFNALKKKCAAPSQNSSQVNSTHRLLQCGAGINSCCIGYDGTFKLCSSLCHSQCVYDLRQGDLNTAWSVFTPRLRSKTSERKSFKKNCMCCDIVSFCSCCPAHADLETGELDGQVPYYCDLAKQRFRNILDNP